MGKPLDNLNFSYLMKPHVTTQFKWGSQTQWRFFLIFQQYKASKNVKQWKTFDITSFLRTIFHSYFTKRFGVFGCFSGRL